MLSMVFLLVRYMIGALAEIASGRRLFVDAFDRKTKETKAGIMQVAPEVAQWLGRELGYKSYDIEDNTNLLYWPLVNIYFGAAYAKWLFSCDDKSGCKQIKNTKLWLMVAEGGFSLTLLNGVITELRNRYHGK